MNMPSHGTDSLHVLYMINLAHSATDYIYDLPDGTEIDTRLEIFKQIVDCMCEAIRVGRVVRHDHLLECANGGQHDASNSGQ